MSVTLIIPPYTYALKDTKKGFVTFECNGCKNMPDKQSTFATVKMVEYDAEGNPRYNLVSADQNHICKPSPVNHLHKIFMHHLRLSSIKDPKKKISEIYKTVRDELCASLEEGMKKQFLDEVKPYHNFDSTLARLRDTFAPDQTRLYPSKPRLWQCDMCDFDTKLYKEYKNHKRSEHKGKKPYQCLSCGKLFSSKDRLRSHEKSGHIQMKGKQYVFKQLKVNVYGMVCLFQAWVVLATQSGIRTPVFTSLRPR